MNVDSEKIEVTLLSHGNGSSLHFKVGDLVTVTKLRGSEFNVMTMRENLPVQYYVYPPSKQQRSKMYEIGYESINNINMMIVFEGYQLLRHDTRQYLSRRITFNEMSRESLMRRNPTCEVELLINTIEHMFRNFHSNSVKCCDQCLVQLLDISTMKRYWLMDQNSPYSMSRVTLV